MALTGEWWIAGEAEIVLLAKETGGSILVRRKLVNKHQQWFDMGDATRPPSGTLANYLLDPADIFSSMPPVEGPMVLFASPSHMKLHTGAEGAAEK